MNHGVLVPRLRGDLPGNVTGAARCLEATSSVLSHNAADDCEGEAYQHPGAQQEENCGGWQSLGGATPPVDGVNYTPSDEQGSFGNKQTPFYHFSIILAPMDANYYIKTTFNILLFAITIKPNIYFEIQSTII